jgi:hypothetical protein
MLGAGTIINPIIKIVTTVAILAAVYFFMLKPILDTTENTISQSFGTINPQVEDTNDQIRQALRQATRQTNQQFEQINVAQQTDSLRDAQRLLGCIQRADGNVDRIQACSR